MGTAAVVVIVTCGYFVYDDRQSKTAAIATEAAAEQRVKYVKCLDSLQSTKDFLTSQNSWEGKSHNERLTAFEDIIAKTQGEDVASLLVTLFEMSLKQCGPI